MKTPSGFSIGIILKQILFSEIHFLIAKSFTIFSSRPSRTQEDEVSPAWVLALIIIKLGICGLLIELIDTNCKICPHNVFPTVYISN